ncbi:dethiobiotin synthase [Planctomicrobium sp. SH661]|uniref:dethiobiotin synthase n=1 Tax=Planctomicrobium sp. SH661 TaxID=3448124 RepID=UPI003F5C5B68
MHGLFITGTDTGVGKTYLTCLLARRLAQRGLSVGVYKPACSGADEEGQSWPDLDRLSQAIDGRFPLDWICPQAFLAPLAPPAAARLEGKSVDSQLLRSGVDRWKGAVDVLLVEGVGGWMCPLTDSETIADLARDLRFPVLTVAANRLGMISQTLLTLQAVKFSGLPTAGAVVNQADSGDDGTSDSNMRLLRQLSNVPLFGPVSWNAAGTERSVELIDEILGHCARAGDLPAVPN